MLVETLRLSVQGNKLIALPMILALLLTAPFLSIVTFVQASTVYAAGMLSVEIIAAPNLVVDSNVLATSTYAPKVATVIGKFCNTGTDPVSNVMAFIGDYTGSGPTLGTPGVYPSKTNPIIGGLAYKGTYQFTHLGGSRDAARSMGALAPGECRYQYWSFEYPHYALDTNDTTIPTWGTSVKSTDDLALDFDMWAIGYDGATQQTANATHTATMRNEISAMANKIKPNGNPAGQWFNTDASTVYPGETITTNGVFYRLGNVNQGFDNNGDGVPDYNAWLQPFGNPSYDPSCFRLLSVTGVLTVTRSAGNPDLIIPIDNNLYFTDLPPDNTDVRGLVYYRFLALGGGCTVPISPYQEVASGSDNEKFNGDYGTGVPALMSYGPEVDIAKNAPGIQAENTTFAYQIPFQNNSTSVRAGLTLSSGGASAGLMISDTVPAGLMYVANSATGNNDIPTGNSVSVRFSTNGGITWSITDPGTIQSTIGNRVVIQWWLNEPLDVSGSGQNSGTVRYQATIPAAYISSGGDPFIENCAESSFGDGAPFDRTCAATMVSGNNSIGDKVWNDANSNGSDDSEAGLPGVTLYLHWDKDGDGVLDSTDPNVATTSTDSSGIYSFPNLPDARYIVLVDLDTAPAGYRPTSPVSGQIAVDLISAGDVHNTTTDFGLGPALSIAKASLETIPTASNGTITYKIELQNHVPGSGSQQRACQYQVWSSSQDTANSGTGQAVWLNISNIFGTRNGTWATDPLVNNSETLAVSGFSISNPGQNITKVELLLPLQVRGTAAGTFQVRLNTYGTSTVQKDFGVEQISTFSNGVRVYTVWQSGDPASVFSSWSAYAGNVYSVVIEGKKSGDLTDLDVDAVAVRITTDGDCSDSSNDITYLPLTDTFDPSVLEFVGASVNPDSTVPAGTLTWNNVGTLYTGGTRELYVTFRVKNSAATGTDNTATATGARFGDGKPANSPVSDTEPVKGIVGDRVWFDINANGVQDIGESGVPGVTVELWSDNGDRTFKSSQDTLLLSTTADDKGNYLFSGLTLGSSYFVRIPNAPTGYTGVSDRDGGTFSDVHIFEPTASKVVDLSYDWGYDTSTNNAGSVNGYVWNDTDADGVIDTGETGYTGVSVQLCSGTTANSCGSLLGTTTTGANGFYQFSNVSIGTNNCYVRVATAPSGTSQTYEYNSLCSGSCDGSTANFSVVSNLITSDINLGYRKTGTSTIGDLVFRDWDGDGVQGTGEEGIQGVTVSLYLDNDGDGVVDSTDHLFAQTTGGGNGDYLFSNLPAGDCVVVVSPPDNHVQTRDPDESGVCSVCDSTSRQINVDGTSSYLTHDYAYRPSGAGSIGDLVWRDMDGDGTQDTGEAGIGSITVSLYEDTDNNDVYDADVDALIATVETGSDGMYLFRGLEAGSYLVVVDPSDPDLPMSGNDPYTPSTATTLAVDLATSSSEVLTADFGFKPYSSLGDLVWQDNDGDGIWDSGEPGINGVVVELYADANNDGVADGAAMSTTTTANNSKGLPGYYLFGGLGAGNYIVRVADSNFQAGGTLANYTQSGDPNASAQPCGAECDNANWLKGTTAPDSTFFPGLQVGQNDMSSDFGYQPNGGAIGDTVWIDSDNDGLRDPDERGIPYVTVMLCTDAACSSPVKTTETDENGYYSFSGLADSTSYYARVDIADADLSAGLSATYGRDGTADGLINNIVLTSGHVSSVNGTGCSNCDLEMDFGYRFDGNKAIQGTAWHDSDNGGINGDLGDGVGKGDIDAGETTRYPDVPVYLWRCVNGCGGTDDVLVSQSTTDAAGQYSFTNLANGDYRVSANSSAYSIDGTNATTPLSYSNIALAGNTTAQRDFGFLSQMDMGDLPAAYRNTTLADNGARHTIPATGATYLGSGVPDQDPDGQESNNASGDGSDEDGVARTPMAPWTTGTDGGSIDVTVGGCAGTCYLSGWIDWGHDNSLLQAGDRILLDYAITNGLHTIKFNIPPGTVITNSTFNARFRLCTASTGGLALPTGLATNGEVEDYQWHLPKPTAVALVSFGTAPQDSAIVVAWETASEIDTLGFALYRAESPDGSWLQLNAELIPSQLPPGSLVGASYQFVDGSAEAGVSYYYWLEAVDIYGQTTQYGPVSGVLLPPTPQSGPYRVFMPAISK